MKIVSVNIGKKTIIQMKNKVVETGIIKKPVAGSIFLDYELVKGDTVSDRVYHGGSDKAVYGYGAQHYEFWQKDYENVRNNHGVFGENITFDTLDETSVRVGNLYQCGDVIIEATKPREPCFKLGLVFNNPSIVRDFWNSTKSGVYFKVIVRGEVKAGDEFILIKEFPKNPSIADVYEIKRNQNK